MFPFIQTPNVDEDQRQRLSCFSTSAEVSCRWSCSWSYSCVCVCDFDVVMSSGFGAGTSNKLMDDVCCCWWRRQRQTRTETLVFCCGWTRRRDGQGTGRTFGLWDRRGGEALQRSEGIKLCRCSALRLHVGGSGSSLPLGI